MRYKHFALVVAFGLCALAASAAPADAQIYAWRDARGTLVLSDRPLERNARSYEVPRSRTIRTTNRAERTRGADFDALIDQHATSHGVRADLVRAVIQVESAFNPRARSSKGAMGLMQLMPATATELGVTNAYDPSENIRGGVAYLRTLLTRYDEDEELALAAYNAGPSAVQRYGNRVPPYKETQQYVSRIRNAASDVPVSHLQLRIYKTLETIDGRAVPHYSNVAAAEVLSGERSLSAAIAVAALSGDSLASAQSASSLEESLQALRAPRARR